MDDVFIVGGGPAGLAAAIALRQKGLCVTVADSQHPPIDKACGEGLLPGGVLAAERLGMRFSAAHSFPLRGIRFVGEGVMVAADFPQGRGLGVRRTELHRALSARAEDCGVDLRWNSPMHDFSSIQARWIIGADGIGSRVRQWADLNSVHRESRRFGFRMHFAIAPWTSYVEVYWGEGCQIYITPVAPDEVGVAVLSRDPKLRVGDALHLFPVLRKRFAGVRPSSTERGGLTAVRVLRRVTRGNAALIGDASGSVDAITGEGVSLGFQQGFVLADSLSAGSLAPYEQTHRKLARRARFMGDLMLKMDRRPWLRKRAFPALARNPRLFGGLLAIHTGAAVHSVFISKRSDTIGSEAGARSSGG